MSKPFIVFLLLFAFGQGTQAQQPPTYVQQSQLAKVFQRIGTTDIEIIYHAPLTKGRTVFGELVPFHDTLHGKPQPWRAGANQNTTIRFTHDVMVNGKPLKAGIYGIHIFVEETRWEVTFSTASTDWGSFAYTAENDALRVSAAPRETPHQDWLSYRFIDPQDHRVTARLHWADKAADIEISTNVHANILADVANMKAPSWNALLDAAKSTLSLNPKATDEALELTSKSISTTPTLANRMFKVDLLEKRGATQEADALKTLAIKEANANELFSLAMDYNNRNEDAEALKILALNMKQNPIHWMAHMGYANYYRTHEDEQALAYYKKALELAPDSAKGFANYQYGYGKRAFGLK